MKQLIINADDFGMTDGVNRSIVECHQRGIVQSTSLMANMRGFDTAITMARQNPSLGVGVHLTLTTGQPILPPSNVPTLVNAHGAFWPLRECVTRLMLGRIDADEVQREYTAQVQRVIDHGLTPTHLDSHHHVHFYPLLMQVARKVAEQCNIRWVRGVNKNCLRGFYCTPQMFLRPQVYASFLKLLVLSQLKVRRAGALSQPDHMIGAAYVPAGQYQSALARFLQRVPDGVTEILCHPGYVDQELLETESWTALREEEMGALTSRQTMTLVSELGLSMTNYGELS
jgi:chitin disaccharide deacetylase